MAHTLEPGRKPTPAAARWAGAELQQTPEQRRFEKALASVRSMTPQQVFQASVDAGVHNVDGTLTEHYRDKP
jgi:hypothetical protein